MQTLYVSLAERLDAALVEAFASNFPNPETDIYEGASVPTVNLTLKFVEKDKPGSAGATQAIPGEHGLQKARIDINAIINVEENSLTVDAALKLPVMTNGNDEIRTETLSTEEKFNLDDREGTDGIIAKVCSYFSQNVDRLMSDSRNS